jgi:ABC-type transport system involved in multi-copper enzyme maturation permease subunit
LTGELTRLGAVAWLSLRGNLRGARVIGLAGFALVPSLIVVAVASTHPAANTLSNSAEGLFAVLTLPIVTMAILLVLSVAQFRNEVDNETLLYLSDRSVTRPTIVVGKYFGSLAAALVLVIPATLTPLGIAVLGGGSMYPVEVPVTLTAAAILAAVAYGGFFLFLGLVARAALLIGLLYGFLWEELVPLLPGSAPRLTLVFYLRNFLSAELTSGPLSGYPAPFSSTVAVLVPIGLAIAFLVLGSIVFRYLETAPERESA